MGYRRGIGNLLAEGSRAAAGVVCQGSEAWAMQVKGLEMPGYEPRSLKTMALGPGDHTKRRLPQPLFSLRSRLF